MLSFDVLLKTDYSPDSAVDHTETKGCAIFGSDERHILVTAAAKQSLAGVIGEEMEESKNNDATAAAENQVSVEMNSLDLALKCMDSRQYGAGP